MKRRVGVLCGGSGSSKFASGLSIVAKQDAEVDLGFIANVADNFWFNGIYVCPDVDILTYALSGRLDRIKSWGIEGDNLYAKEMLSTLSSSQVWFNLGDKDMALAQRRTDLMGKGWSLSGITEYFCKKMMISDVLVPATDDSVQTFVRTRSGNMHLQEFWVKNGGKSNVVDVQFVGLEEAHPNETALEFCSNHVIICPANPISSVLPTFKIRGFERTLKKARVIAVSPFIENKPFSGPAGKLLQGLGIETSSYGVAKIYSSFLKLFVVDKTEEKKITLRIQDELGIECIRTNIRITSEEDKRQISRELLDSI